MVDAHRRLFASLACCSRSELASAADFGRRLRDTRRTSLGVLYRARKLSPNDADGFPNRRSRGSLPLRPGPRPSPAA